MLARWRRQFGKSLSIDEAFRLITQLKMQRNREVGAPANSVSSTGRPSSYRSHSGQASQLFSSTARNAQVLANTCGNPVI